MDQANNLVRSRSWIGSQLIEENGAPAELWPSFLTGNITFEVESPMDSGDYIKEVSLVVRSNEPMADHEVNNHWMR